MRAIIPEIREALGYMDEEIIIFDNPAYDEAIVGISNDGRLVYDMEKMVECLVENENMEINEAIEFIDYNMSLTYGDKSPVIIATKIEDII